MSETVEVYFDAIDETERGLRVTDGSSKIWLPKSKIKVTRFRGPQSTAVTVVMPTWLARKTGIV